ncbi:DUF692 family multinuclear iron-containing protein [Streptomyces sp. NPDC060194]|uniref:multinuclear nonheme iron-dependent oxidase n=1 Tax=Streptomyces sp. NPDC060194 TaxID=3347069 RepID=UPI0036510F5B
MAQHTHRIAHLGTGIGWRPEIADAVERMAGIDWVEAVAENICPGHLPESLVRLRGRGVTVVPHGVSLGLGGAERPDTARLAALAERAEALGSPLVTEHIAFVRAGGPMTASAPLEAGHLLPVPRTRDALDVLCANVRIAQDALPVPLALENIAALVSWPGEEMTEGQFLAELVERTGVRLLIDVANLHTNHVNRGEDPARALDELPVEAIAYVHVAGGFERDGVWHDSHAHPVPAPVLDILADLASRVAPPGVLLERDENFPAPAELAAELDSIRTVLTKASVRPAVRGGVRAGAPARQLAAVGAGGAARQPGRAPADAAVPGPVAATGPDGGPGAGGTRPGDAGPRTRAAAPSLAGTGLQGSAEGPAGAGAQAAGTAAPPSAGTRIEAPVDGEAGRVAVARHRVAVAQTALLSALVAGTPAPEGFDRRRLLVQSRALAAKRADVVGKVAPELPVILGAEYRAAFLGYARSRPMAGGYRRDALDFAEHLLLAGRPADPAARGELTLWWQERNGLAPEPGPVRRVVARALTAFRYGKG